MLAVLLDRRGRGNPPPGLVPQRTRYFGHRRLVVGIEGAQFLTEQMQFILYEQGGAGVVKGPVEDTHLAALRGPLTLLSLLCRRASCAVRVDETGSMYRTEYVEASEQVREP